MGQLAICKQCNAPADDVNRKLKGNKLTQNYQLNADVANGDMDFYEKNEQKATSLQQLAELENKNKITQLTFECQLYDTHVDVVEEHLQEMSQIRILILKLRGGKLENEGSIRLANMFNNLKNIMTKINHLELNISQNKINDSGMQALATSLGNYTALKQLHLRVGDNLFQELGGISIGENIQLLTKLTHVYLDVQYSKVHGPGSLRISEALKSLSKLVNLEFRFKDDDQPKSAVEQVFKNLSSFRVCEKLRIEYRCTDVSDPNQFRKDMETLLKKNPFCAKDLNVCQVLN